MDKAIFELLSVIVEMENHTRIQSLFRLSVEAFNNYSWGWRVLRDAEGRGYVTVERNGHGLPLKIASTECGRSALAIHLSHGCMVEEPAI